MIPKPHAKIGDIVVIKEELGAQLDEDVEYVQALIIRAEVYNNKKLKYWLYLCEYVDELRDGEKAYWTLNNEEILINLTTGEDFQKEGLLSHNE